MRTTKKEKLAQYDSVIAERDRYSMAMHDMVNHKFSMAVIGNLLDARYKISMSWRAMPLFLVVYQFPGQDDQATVLSEDQIQDAYRENPGHAYVAMLMRARNELVAKIPNYPQRPLLASGTR